MKTLSWRAIKTAYMYEDPCPHARELAKRFNCSASSIQKRCASENWKQQRLDRDEVAQAKAQSKEVERRAEELAKMRVDSEEAITRARYNHRIFQACVGSLNARVAEGLRQNMVDALDLDVWIKANKADADITAKLHGIPQLVDVTDNRQQADVSSIRERVEAYEKQQRKQGAQA